jgi:tRNA(fMet)-specific endonuclease VapC
MLDTNTCVFVMNNVVSVRDRFLAEYPHGLCVSAITEAELWFGVENSSRLEKNTETLMAFLATVDTMPFDTVAAAAYGRVRAELKRVGTLIGSMDMLIAAHAMSLGLTLVTNNTREFGRVAGLSIVDWLAV